MKTKFNGILTLLLAFVVQISFAQEKTISGTVSDENGPLPGVSVLKKGTTQGTETDFDGKYTIKTKTGDVLVFSFVGMETVEKTVGASNNINVAMQSGNVLDEIVVVGYGNVEDKKLIQNVTRIKNEEIRDIPAVTTQELLQGQSSGVQLVQSSGILGASSVIKVRGVGSLTAGSQPLIVIDGIPLNDNDNTYNNGGNVGLNPLQDISPEDIESFSVLKDASAVAIYGSRGANGVILITTKRGKKGDKARIELNVSTSLTQATDLMPMMNAQQYKEYYSTKRGININLLPKGEFDWVDAVTRDGISQNYNASISGATERSNYYLSMGYRDQSGFIVGNDLQRLSTRLNLETQANDWLKTGMSLSYTTTDNDRVSSENSTWAPLTTAYLIKPWVAPRDSDGNLLNTGFIQNVVGIEELNTNLVESSRFLANVFAKINLTKGLFYRADFGTDISDTQTFWRDAELFAPKTEGGVKVPGGKAGIFRGTDKKWLTNHTLNYSNEFNDSHSLSVLAGISYERSIDETIELESEGFLSDKLRNVSSGGEKTVTEQNRTQWALYGMFSRISYDYLGKYLLEGSVRRDGSSRFGDKNRYGTFWSVAGGWEISKESFMQDLSFVNSLKLTASYGTTGNDRIGNFPSLGLFGNLAYNNTPGLTPIQANNADLKWETSKTLDVGLSTSLFNNRLSLKANYFNKKTSDLLLNIPVTWLSGFNSITKNAGTMTNSGFEFSLNSKNVQGDDFKWSTNFNISFIKNKITSLPGASISPEGNFVAGSSRQRAIVGYSANTFYLVKYKGINPANGDAEWYDKDGNVTTNPNFDTDRVIAGDANPDFYGGISNNFKYKNFDLNVLMSFSYGNDIFLDGLRYSASPSSYRSFNQSTLILDYWKNPGDNAYAPRLNSPTERTFRQTSTAQLKDGSYLRMRNVTLGYNFPKSYLEKSFISNVRLYATANNLFTIKSSELDGFDPEVTNNTNPLIQGETFFTAPQAKTYLLGARISF